MEINHIGNKIKKLVEDKNMPIQELAYKTGKSVTAMYDIFRKKDINTEVLGKISQALGVSLTYWFTENLESNYEEQKTAHESSPAKDIIIAQLKIKDDQISFLQEMIRDMKKK
jgi:transcriptional regulator with XRE-family HTH domain